jgi:hypothetical protein
MTVFSKFESVHGSPENCLPVPIEIQQKYQNLLPELLLKQWAESGWCSFAQGFFWLVDPDQYIVPLQEWLPEEIANRAIIFARTSFGHLYIWLDNRVYAIDVLFGALSKLSKRISFLFDYTLCQQAYLDDALLYSIYQQAVPKQGMPERNECFGFVPALALGGPCSAKNLKRMKIREHLSILSQLVTI